ncbi:2OG-Fe(II) oxygenase [Marinihelvus fidelis]|uniref:2OG-Fe(II) oxygenase n=1 Tax=Marinihelvus fidelis TaxID=2613842 RepID=A0A5N0TDS8_9GAMM|nr:2OG-Fe(II) oxygenase [Marinihelvus fidelis]KAA9133253.1 2OG-Fe(II) oxygenase [Marinihelvus fidelis]
MGQDHTASGAAPVAVPEMVSAEVLERADALGQAFRTASPFRHVAVDGFFRPEVATELLAAFPAFDEKLAMNENGQVGGKAVNEKVTGLGPVYQRLDQLVSSREFRDLVSQLTGIPDLQYDPYYFGGGTHENLHGQGLDAHVDFNFHPKTRQHRRLNMIFYLTEEWQDEWGGSIQLHRDPHLPPSQDEIVTITPLFNRCVIFETTETSWHGFPRIELPEDKRGLSRKSFALYYYTETRPAEELGPEHSTIYVEQHLPESWQPGITLDGEQLQHVRNLIASRDQHLTRLYEDIKRINTELNALKESRGIQAPPGVAPETGEPVATEDDAERSAEQRLEALEAALGRREAEAARLAMRVRELESSTSWRVTRPLRGFKRLISGQR